MPLVDYTRTKRPVFDIDLDADPYDRWQEVGRRNKVKLGRFLRDIEKMVAEYANTWYWRALLTSTTVVGPLAVLIARLFGEDYQGEDCEICDRYAALHNRLKKRSRRTSPTPSVASAAAP